MSRKRVLIHAITWTTLVVFIVIVGSSSLVNGDPVSEVRSNAGSNPYVQSRPAYQKPAPYKPKLVLAKQLQLQPATGAGKDPTNPNLVTQTVYGFLDFTTTVGNTVMVFTPQTRNVELIQPSATLSSIAATETPEADEADDEDDDYSSTTTTTTRTTTARQPKLLSLNTEESDDDEEPQITFLESSETDAVPQQTTSTPHASTKSKKNGVVLATAVVGEYVNLATEPSTSTSTTPKSKKATTSSPVEIRTQVNVVASGGGETETERPTSTTPKGFTLKLSNKSASSSSSSSKKAAAEPAISNGTISSSSTFHVTSTPSSVFAQVVATPLKSFSKFAHVTAQVVTPTKATSTSTAPASSATTLLPKSQAAAKKAASASPTQTSPKAEVRTEQSVVASSSNSNSGDDEDDDGHKGEEGSEEQFNEEHQENDEERLEEGEERNDEEPEAEIKPTATTSPKPEDQTLYVLPQKPKEKVAQIYASKTASPDSYSREPQLYVDVVQPARSFDNYYATSTPSSSLSGRKQFRSQNPSGTGSSGSRNEYSNRFTNRFSRKQASSTESNELTDRPTAASYEEEAPSPPSTFTRTRGGSSGGNRFRSRNNRGSGKSQYVAEVEPTASLVYSNSVTATPSRRFSGGRTRNGAAAAKNYQEYSENSTPKSSRGGYSPSRQKVTITPTTSTSIYRFKLNRPTGRWRFKPSPKPKVSIIKSKDDEPTVAPESDDPQQQFQVRELLQQQSNGPVYPQQYGVPVDGNENYQYAPSGGSAVQYEEDPRAENNELVDEHGNGPAASPLESLAPTTIRVATVTPAEFSDLEKYLEIATIKSPYVFQAGNVKNTRYITVTKTFTKEVIQPTQALEAHETLENILATRAPYEKILEGSNDVATLPVVVLGEDMATPPLETVTQTFSTTQLMLKTSILPVLYDGVTTLYTLTQSYFVTRLVTAHKTVPPMELFQFVPTKSLTEFNTALQEAESEHREQLLGSEDSEENDQQYQQIVAAPDELKLVGSEFDPSFMEDKIPQKQLSKSSKSIGGSKKIVAAASNSTLNSAIPDLSNLTPEQLAFFRFLTAQNQAAAAQQHLQQPSPNPLLPNFFPSPQLPIPSVPQFQLQSSPVVIDTVATVVETKTLRILFGAKPTQTTLYSTRVIPTKVTTYISAPLATAAPALPQIPNYFQAGAYPFGAFVG